VNIKWYEIIWNAIFMTIGWGIGVTNGGTSLWWAPLICVGFLSGFLLVELVEWAGGMFLRRVRASHD